MLYLCKRKTSLRRLVGLLTMLALLTALFTGCFLSDSSESTEDTGNLPNLIEDQTEPSVSDTSDTTGETTDETTETVGENIAIVLEQVNVRAQPSTTSQVIGQLNAGEQFLVKDIYTVHGLKWAQLESGWVPCSALDTSAVTLDDDSDSNSTEASTEASESTDATTATESSDTTTTSGDTQYGVVIAEGGLNIREDATTSSDKVGQYDYGTRVTITQTSNGWGKTDKGWISLSYVYIDGDSGSNGCTGKVIAEGGLSVRSGPGTNYERVSVLSYGTTVTVKQRVKIGNYYWGYASGGWIRMDYVDVDGEDDTTTTSDTTTTTATTGTGTVTATGGLTIRSGAGTDYDAVGGLSYGDRVTIQETQTVDGVQWGRISDGWICMTYVKMD